MKKHFLLGLMSIVTLYVSSCSSDDDSGASDDPQSENSEFAMTAKVNDVTFEANNPFGTNEFSSTNIWNYFPIEDYVMLQGRQGGLLGNLEINIWLKRSDISTGTYQIGEETYDTPPSHFIDLVDYKDITPEDTKEGTITITEVNTSTKIVTGTFDFIAVDNISESTADSEIKVTEGTFSYTYE